ncbi:fructose-2,6-bisphosphatase [Burkholderiales bacterium JOSHI_001]|nr:fructose-2,6-bisphosphatase [Burkholderiales bacterium JOSHI_001]
MSLLLIRHGETALNAARVMQPPDTPLSERGLAQAEALAQRLKTAGLAAIVASDLPRALQTAQAIARATGLPVTTSALLHERNFGDWRGRPHASLGFDALTTQTAPPNGETTATFEARVAAAWDWVLAQKQAAGGPLAVVSHGLVVMRWLRAHARVPAGLVLPERIGNTALSVVAAAPPHAASLVDCTAHLDGATAEDANSLSGG